MATVRGFSRGRAPTQHHASSAASLPIVQLVDASDDRLGLMVRFRPDRLVELDEADAKFFDGAAD
jgi:hypothetical protein